MLPYGIPESAVYRISEDELALSSIRRFLTANPEFILAIIKASYRGFDDVSYSSALWEAVFRFTYRSSPVSLEGTGGRSGSTDPRWEELFFERKYLRGFGFVRCALTR
jgi:hypothetical protein